MLVFTKSEQKLKIPCKTIVEDVVTKSHDSTRGFPFKGVLEEIQKLRSLGGQVWYNFDIQYFIEYYRNKHQDFPDFSFEKSYDDETYISVNDSLEKKVRKYVLSQIRFRYLKQHWGGNGVYVQSKIYGGKTKQELEVAFTKGMTDEEARKIELIKYLKPIYTVSRLWNVDLFPFINDYCKYAGVLNKKGKTTEYYSTKYAQERGVPLYTKDCSRPPVWKLNSHETAQKTYMNRDFVDCQQYRFAYNQLRSRKERKQFYDQDGNITKIWYNLNVFFRGLRNVIEKYNIEWDIQYIRDHTKKEDVWFMNDELFDGTDECLVYNGEEVLNYCIQAMRNESELIKINRGILDVSNLMHRVSYNRSVSGDYEEEAYVFVKKYCPFYTEKSKLSFDEYGNVLCDDKIALLYVGDADDAVTGNAYGRLISECAGKLTYEDCLNSGTYGFVNVCGLYLQILHADVTEVSILSLSEVGIGV